MPFITAIIYIVPDINLLFAYELKMWKNILIYDDKPKEVIQKLFKTVKELSKGLGIKLMYRNHSAVYPHI